MINSRKTDGNCGNYLCPLMCKLLETKNDLNDIKL